MWLFIIADAMTFAALLVGLRIPAKCHPRLAGAFHFHQHHQRGGDDLHPRHQQPDHASCDPGREGGDKAGAFRWTLITVAGGIVFALLHIREWLGLIGEGMTLFKNPWGTALFGATFFAITGLHITHVIGGVIALTWLRLGYKGGRYNADDIEIWSLVLALCGPGLDVRRAHGLPFEYLSIT